MRVIFLAEKPCALTVNAAFLGTVDGFERSAEINPGDGVFCELLPVGYAPVRFRFDENFLRSPPEQVNLYFIRGGVAVLLAYLKHDPEPIAFGNCGLAPNSWEALLPAFGVSTEKEAPMPEEEKDTMPAQEEVSTDMPPFREAKSYDDEAIASADYFGGEGRGDEDASPAGEDETFAPISFGARLAYYESVRDRLERAFSSYPRDERLLGIFPHSEWVRTEGGLLGVIYEEGRPRYLCVAAEDPPAEMRKRSLFVPLSPFGEGGIYVVFQSADTGDYIGVEEG